MAQKKGIAFSDLEDRYIVRLVNDAIKKKEKISVSLITQKLNSRPKSRFARTRPAVNHRVQILVREDRIPVTTIVKGKDKTPYIKDEDRVLVKALSKAVKEKRTVTMRELTEVLGKADKSPIKRTEPSVRARVTNVLLANDGTNLAAIHSRAVKKTG